MRRFQLQNVMNNSAGNDHYVTGSNARARAGLRKRSGRKWFLNVCTGLEGRVPARETCSLVSVLIVLWSRYARCVHCARVHHVVHYCTLRRASNLALVLKRISMRLGKRARAFGLASSWDFFGPVEALIVSVKYAWQGGWRVSRCRTGGRSDGNGSDSAAAAAWRCGSSTRPRSNSGGLSRR
jgi:hypothetical protein